MSVIDIRSAKDRQDLAGNSRSEQIAQTRKQLKIVVLDCPYDTVNDPLTRELLGKIAQFKINSYLDDWSYGVLPLDAGDFIGVHLLLCQDSGSGLEIVAGFKMLTHDRCREFGLEFPAFHALNGTQGTQPHHHAIERVVSAADRRGQSVGYLCSWAVRPDAKKSRTLARFCRDITTALIVKGCESQNVPYAIAYGVQRLRVDRYHESLGFKPLTLDGKSLPVFTSRSYMGEALTTALVDASSFSEEARQIAAEYQDLWDARIEIRAERAAAAKKAA